MFRIVAATLCWSASLVALRAHEPAKESSEPVVGMQVPLSPTTTIRFATAKEGAAALGKRDRYVAAQGPWDRPARLRTNDNVGEEDYLKFAAAQATEWPDAERKEVAAAIDIARERLRPWKLPFPKEVLFIHTTGKEEGRAAYCRANAVILPTNMVAGKKGDSLVGLVLHELFHVLSSHNPKLQARLYGVIGFTGCGPVALPPELEALRITNPDAPVVEHAVEIQIDGKPVLVAPILLAKEKYDAKKGGTLFDYLQFKLLAVAKDEKGRANVVMRDDKPWLLDPRATPGYHDRIGRNTGYIIHPEEIMADNFMHTVLGRQDAPTPQILEDVKKILESAGEG